MATPGARPSSAGGVTRCADCSDGLGRAREVEPGTWRARLQGNRALALAWRTAVFAAGLLCIAGGVALAVLPGPLTIPPVLLGLWIWSTEFSWARRSFTTFQRKAAEARRHAREHPVSSTAITVGGLVLAVAAVVAVRQFELVDRARTAIGI
jgi:hypothetical protein